MKRILLLFIILIPALSIVAQKEANFWYFGHYAGMNFALGIPVALTNGALYTGEGCSSISTSTGNLQFYTDGRFVYNKDHSQMPHGSGLLGHSSSTQSGIIVPKPASTTQYYIFTVDAYDNSLANGLCYSRVDMTLDGGLGDVVTSEKNISLIPLTCEKVTAVGHSNGISIWVITHQWGTDAFYAYEITTAGVNLTPVISHTGPPLIGDMQASKGYIKVSPDGSKIAMANNTAFMVGIFSFNHANGTVTHLVTDYNFVNPGGNDPGGPYGVEFSANSHLLYIGEWKANRKIYQYDLTSGDPTTILNSRVIVASVGQSSQPIGALQLGPDNRLYIARYENPYISRINSPNVIGTGCGFVENALNLAGRESTYGLPPFIQSFFYLTADFYWDTPLCDGTPIQFYTSASDNPDSVKWNFGDPDSGPENTSTLINPTHLYTSTGNFWVTLVVYLYGVAKNVFHIIVVHEQPEVFIGNDTTMCASVPFILDADTGFAHYLWQNGDSTQTTVAETSGLYWCQVTGEGGCTDTDSINLIVNPAYDIIMDTAICQGESFFAGGGWQTQTGTYYDYYLTAHDCDSILTTNLMVNDTFQLVLDMSICEGDSIFAGGDWQTETGIYYDHYQTVNGCDSNWVTNLTIANNMSIYENMTICEGDSAFLQGGWQIQAGTYRDTVSSGTGCDSIFITQLSLADTFYIMSTASICQGDSIYIGGAWRKVAGNYFDYKQTQLGCDSTIRTQLSIIAPVYGADQACICQGDSILIGGIWRKLAGTYDKYLQSSLGCDSIVAVDLTVIAPVYGNDSITICQGDSIFLGGAYRKTAGNYTEILAAPSTGCDSILTTQLTVNQVYLSELDTSICEGGQIYLGGGYQNQEGTYEDYFVTVNGCDSIIRTYLSLVFLPKVFLGNDTILQIGSELWLYAFYPGASYLWQDGSYDSILSVTETGNYHVVVTTQCGFDTDSIHVLFGNYYCDPFVPNAFTPNGDGQNDIFLPVFSCEILEYQLLIYDRWGTLLFKTNEQGQGWDGRINGELAPGEVYVWLIVFRSGLYDRIVQRTAKGNIVVIR